MDSAPKEKRPASSVEVRWVMLLPVIETATPAAGLPLSVTVPVTKVGDAGVPAAAQATSAVLTAQTNRTKRIEKLSKSGHWCGTGSLDPVNQGVVPEL